MYTQVKLPIPGDQIINRLRTRLPRSSSNLTYRLGGPDSKFTVRLRLIEGSEGTLLQLTHTGTGKYNRAPEGVEDHLATFTVVIDLRNGNIVQSKQYVEYALLAAPFDLPDLIDDVVDVLGSIPSARLSKVRISSNVLYGGDGTSAGLHYVYQAGKGDRTVFSSRSSLADDYETSQSIKTSLSYDIKETGPAILSGEHVCAVAGNSLKAFRLYLGGHAGVVTGAIIHAGAIFLGPEPDPARNAISIVDSVMFALFGPNGLCEDTESIQYVVEKYLPIHDRQSRNGFERTDPEYYAAKVHEEMDEVLADLKAGHRDHAEMEIGDLLSVVFSMCHKLGFSPAHALTRAARKFELRVVRCERYFKENGIDSKTASDEEWHKAWSYSKELDVKLRFAELISNGYHKPIPGISSF